MPSEATLNVWTPYYRLRNRARASVLAVPVFLYFLLQLSPILSLKLSMLEFPSQIAIIFLGLGIVTVVFAAPVLKWAEWRCPRCGQKFSQPRVQIAFGVWQFLLLGSLMTRLLWGRSCASCELPCGSTAMLIPQA
jgi:hypothetical protein